MKILCTLSIVLASILTCHAQQRIIVEGEGWDQFKLGSTRETLIKTFGQPESGSTDRWLVWKKAHRIHCLIDDSRGAFEVRFDEGFNGTTKAGITFGSSMNQATSAYGLPDITEINECKKLEWSSKGILIWFRNDKAFQIVAFNPYNVKPAEDAILPRNIAEGVGWDQFKLGATRKELIRALGQPDKGSDDRWLQWKNKHVHCLVDKSRGAFELRFDAGFQGATSKGITFGSPLEKVLNAYGKPNETMPGGISRKLIWKRQGILIWFRDGIATQIVVIAPSQSEQTAEQN